MVEIRRCLLLTDDPPNLHRLSTAIPLHAPGVRIILCACELKTQDIAFSRFDQVKKYVKNRRASAPFQGILRTSSDPDPVSDQTPDLRPGLLPDLLKKGDPGARPEQQRGSLTGYIAAEDRRQAQQTKISNQNLFGGDSFLVNSTSAQ